MRSSLPSEQSGLTLVSELSDSDLEWIFTAGKRQRMPANGVVVAEGSDVGSFYLVLQGLLSVYLSAVGGKELATLGAGQTVGEMSFLEHRPAAATVKTLEESELLAIPRSDLASKIERDPAFAARLYKALAMVTSRRLRETVGTIRRWLDDQPPAEPQTLQRWQHIADETQRFKERLVKIAKNPGSVNAAAINEFAKGFEALCEFMNKTIGDSSSELIDSREELGARIQREILPYLLKSQTVNRFYTKPRGYAGDFRTTELVYRREPAGEGAAGVIFDRAFLDLPFIEAVRNCRDLITAEIVQRAEKQRKPVHVTAICSGIADEVFSAFERIPNRDRLKATLIDFDPQALAAVTTRREEAKLQSQIELRSSNLFDLATGRAATNAADQDLVYSITLAHYFDDKLLTKLFNDMHRLLKPGGKAIIASFHQDNRFKAFMDYIIAWKVTHRTERDLEDLFVASAFRGPCANIRFEARKLIFLAECEKTR